MILVYLTQCGFGDSQENYFCLSLKNVVRKLGEKEILFIAKTLMVTLILTQKTMRISMEVMVMDLGRKKGKRILEFVQL